MPRKRCHPSTGGEAQNFLNSAINFVHYSFNHEINKNEGSRRLMVERKKVGKENKQPEHRSLSVCLIFLSNSSFYIL